MLFFMTLIPIFVLSVLSQVTDMDRAVIQISTEAVLSLLVFGAAQAIVFFKWGSGISKQMTDLKADIKILEPFVNEKYDTLRNDVNDHENRLRIIEHDR